MAATHAHPDRPDTPRNRGETDAPHVSPVSPSEDARSLLINKVSWGAILAGVALALVTHLILSMIGIGVGAATLDPGSGDNPSAAAFSLTAAIWWGVSGIVASLLGGLAAGRLSGAPKESTASWHGLASWAVTTLVIFYLVTTTATTLLGGAFSTLGSAMGGAAATAAASAVQSGGAGDAFSAIQQSILGGGQSQQQGTTQQGTTQQGGQSATGEAAVAAVRALLTGSPEDQNRAREEAAQAVAAARGIPIEEARTQVQQYEQQYRETAQTAAQAADTAATAVSTGALAGALALLLGALAAWFGGRMGAVDPTVTAAGLRSRRA